MKLVIIGKSFKGHELKQLLLLNLFGDMDYCISVCKDHQCIYGLFVKWVSLVHVSLKGYT